MRSVAIVAFAVVLTLATPAHAGQRAYVGGQGGNGYGQGGDATSDSSSQATSNASVDNTIVFEQPPPPPVPVEHGMDCWHGYDVPSYDHPGVTTHVRIWQCEPIGAHQ